MVGAGPHRDALAVRPNHEGGSVVVVDTHVADLRRAVALAGPKIADHGFHVPAARSAVSNRAHDELAVFQVHDGSLVLEPAPATIVVERAERPVGHSVDAGQTDRGWRADPASTTAGLSSGSVATDGKVETTVSAGRPAGADGTRTARTAANKRGSTLSKGPALELDAAPGATGTAAAATGRCTVDRMDAAIGPCPTLRGRRATASISDHLPPSSAPPPVPVAPPVLSFPPEPTAPPASALRPLPTTPAASFPLGKPEREHPVQAKQSTRSAMTLI